MTPSPPSDVTLLLRNARSGDDSAQTRLYERVYDELRRIAASQLARRPNAESWQPTALVNEAYLRMVAPKELDVSDRSHFFAVAVTVMRRVLVDQYRRQHMKKRSSDGARVTLDAALIESDTNDFDVLVLDEALTALAELDARKARVVELRFFGGLQVAEVAATLQVSRRTVESDWFFARAWLRTRLEETA